MGIYMDVNNIINGIVILFSMEIYMYMEINNILNG
jgi:hypothetical protein